jgi:uncharacterized SAM-binding protein YcdF (DUF218 family)
VNSDDLFFYSAKVLGWFLKIDNLLVLGVIITIYLFWSRRTKLAKRATIALALSLALFSNLGLSYAALRTLEDAYPTPTIACGKDHQGVIVLGGGINPGLIPEQRGQTQLNEAGERITKALELLNRCPEFKALYSTFSGSLLPEGLSESQSARLFFKDQRVPSSRLIFEDQSRNTFENAKLSLEVVGSKEGWILVTSASHMPRAMKTFERFGWEVTPYPVDFRSESRGKYLDFARENAIRNWNNVIHEWVGSIAYRLRSV